MDAVSTVINASVVAVVGLILAWLGKGRFEAQDQRIARLEERLEGRMDGLDERMESLRSDLTGSMEALRRI
jgi:hypothetical protein